MQELRFSLKDLVPHHHQNTAAIVDPTVIVPIAVDSLPINGPVPPQPGTTAALQDALDAINSNQNSTIMGTVNVAP